MDNTRKIEAQDLWSAIRGLGMNGMTFDELLTLRAEHDDKPAFASKVIAEAARQMASLKAPRGLCSTRRP